MFVEQVMIRDSLFDVMLQEMNIPFKGMFVEQVMIPRDSLFDVMRDSLFDVMLQEMNMTV